MLIDKVDEFFKYCIGYFYVMKVFVVTFDSFEDFKGFFFGVFFGGCFFGSGGSFSVRCGTVIAMGSSAQVSAAAATEAAVRLLFGTTHM